ncbi:hypothetical protein OKW24_005729 [Peribacillus simplex]|uniref:hypothetical protein n=1 Tax=Peribacillus simplex TaxID=1478 RepID=UPI0024E1D7B8|nr:hypothetical protein [Peribacillus simplex]MDF9763833.1 hypothetical protein [Peribacillus simplex]
MNPEVAALIESKIKKMNRYFKSVEMLNRNRFNCVRHDGSVSKVVVTDAYYMTIDGTSFGYID